MNQVIIKGEVVVVDIFITPKDDSIIVIGPSNIIAKRVGVDLEKVEFYVDGELSEIEYITVKNSRYFNEIAGNILDTFNNHIFLAKLKKVGTIIDFNILDENYSFTLQPKITEFCNKPCVTTIFKNDYYLVEEWSKYYFKLGFKHIFLYDNDFGKNTYYIDDNITVINANWKYYQTINNIRYTIGQVIQQNHTIWKYNPNILALIDLDEFIVPKYINIFDETLYRDYCGISMPSYFFGCNKQSTKNNILVNYTVREKVDNKFNQRKCIINSNLVDIFCVHIPLEYKKDLLYISPEHLQLNHYYLLSGSRTICNCKVYCQVSDKTIYRFLK